MKDKPVDRPIRIYLCECGPIIRDALDLDALGEAVRGIDGVQSVKRHATLCSTEGQAWMASDLAEHTDCRVVVAACSPREHEETFRGVCREAGINPFLLGIANVREQCAWVTPDIRQGTDKALKVVRAVVARTMCQVPLEEKRVDCISDVLVVGGGVAGLTAARLLAQGDRNVVLVERTGALGGRAALLSEVYPSMECASCLLEPLMDEVLHDPRIEVMTASEVEKVLGIAGNFTATICRRARHVDTSGCYGCGTCVASCPVQVPNEVDEGLGTRGAIHFSYTGSLPAVPILDERTCLAFNGRPCDACATACPFGNIDLGALEEKVERRIGAVILATGGRTRLDRDLGPRVISAMALDRLLNPSGPTGGEVVIAGASPRSVALIHCVDERGDGPCQTCSKTCCLTFARQARRLLEKLGQCEIHQIFWERCAGGKGHREFSDEARGAAGLHQVQLASDDFLQAPRTEGDHAVVRYTHRGRPMALRVDLAVIAPPLDGTAGDDALIVGMGVQIDGRGFVIEENQHLLPFRTRVPGVLVAGAIRGPADVQDSCAQGAAAAGSALSTFVPGRKLAVEPATARVDATRCGGCRTCILSCPYGAARWDPDAGVAMIDEQVCRGCGSCASACPSGAIEARHFTGQQILAEIIAHTGADNG